MTAVGLSSFDKCPAFGIIYRTELGIKESISSKKTTGVTLSSSPTIISVGTVIVDRTLVESFLLPIALDEDAIHLAEASRIILWPRILISG